MTLGQMKVIIDNILTYSPESIGNPVLITTQDKSCGWRAYSEIEFITEGLDWENGQIRIEPKDKLYKEVQNNG